MIFQFGQFEIDVDVNRTREFYKKMENVSKGCNCTGCRNFEKAVDFLPGNVIGFFDTLGIDMKKITEVFVNTTNPDGTVFYGGFYHLCGKLLKGGSAWIEEPTNTENANLFHWEQSNSYSLCKDFYVSFGNVNALVEKDFPKPVLTLDIQANIPWVLNEPNTYS